MSKLPNPKTVDHQTQPRTNGASKEAATAAPLGAQTVIALQRAAGNRAVGQLLVGGNGHAEPNGNGNGNGNGHPNYLLQRKPANGMGEGALEAQAERVETAVAKEPAAGNALLVEDEVQSLQPGQMHKTEFLSALKTSVCTAADEELKGTIWSTMGCPYVERWFEVYQSKGSAAVERALQKYAPETQTASSAEQYIPLVTQKVRKGVAVWRKTGEVTDVPPEFAEGGMPGATFEGLVGAGLSALGSAIGGAISGAARAIGSGIASIGRALFKAQPGGANESEDPNAIQAQLQGGHPLDGEVRGKMETAFGQDFSRVRVHTDATAWQLSQNLNARAFTVGNAVAFGAGEYQPGSLIGDALIAHELAHVVQQGNGKTQGAQTKGAAYDALEEDADVSAVGAVATQFSGAQGAPQDIGREAMPRLRSGLQLQRCSHSKQAQKSTQTPQQAGQGGPLQNVCSVKTPENCPTYEGWLGNFIDLPTYFSMTGHRVLGKEEAPAATATDTNAPTGKRRPPVLHARKDYLPTDRFIDGPTEKWVRDNLPPNLVETAYQLPSDCADIAVILRHVWLAAHNRTELYHGWLCGSRIGEARSRDINELILNQVYSGSVQGIVNPYTDARGNRLLSFQQLQRILHPGDILVWEHHDERGNRSGGHTHTIIDVQRNKAGDVTEITALQGNQPLGRERAEHLRQTDIEAQQALPRAERQTTPTVEQLRKAPGRRIEVSKLSNLGFEDDPTGNVWTWDDGTTTLVAAGPPAAAPRPAPQRVRGQPTVRRLTDWVGALQGATLDNLESTFESALLEARSTVEGGDVVSEQDARSVGHAAGAKLRELARTAGEQANQTQRQALARMQSQIRAFRDASNAAGARTLFDSIDGGLASGVRGD